MDAVISYSFEPLKLFCALTKYVLPLFTVVNCPLGSVNTNVSCSKVSLSVSVNVIVDKLFVLALASFEFKNPLAVELLKLGTGALLIAILTCTSDEVVVPKALLAVTLPLTKLVLSNVKFEELILVPTLNFPFEVLIVMCSEPVNSNFTVSLELKSACVPVLPLLFTLIKSPFVALSIM